MARGSNSADPTGGYDYQHCYCEENVWRMLAHRDFAGKACWAVFISNPKRTVALWHARGAQPSKPLIWDYHCVMLSRLPNWFVWDQDSALGLPCAARTYFQYSFSPQVSEDYRPLFRLVPADIYLREFASDRSHMRDPQGVYLAEPPIWPPILSGEPNLERWIDMSAGRRHELLDLPSLLEQLGLTESAQSLVQQKTLPLSPAK